MRSSLNITHSDSGLKTIFLVNMSSVPTLLPQKYPLYFGFLMICAIRIKPDANPNLKKFSRIHQAIQRISRKTRNGFRDNQIKHAVFGILNHFIKLHSGFDRRTRNAVINVFAHECPCRNTLDFLAVMLDLIFNRRCLLQRLGRYTAIGYDPKRNISDRFMLKHFFHFIHIHVFIASRIDIPILSWSRFLTQTIRRIGNLFLFSRTLSAGLLRRSFRIPSIRLFLLSRETY